MTPSRQRALLNIGFDSERQTESQDDDTRVKKEQVDRENCNSTDDTGVGTTQRTPTKRSGPAQWEAIWQQRLEQLIDYKNKFGNLNVPWNESTNRQLGRWVSSQRSRFRAGSMTSSRQLALLNIGFDFKKSDVNKNEGTSIRLSRKRKESDTVYDISAKSSKTNVQDLESTSNKNGNKRTSYRKRNKVDYVEITDDVEKDQHHSNDKKNPLQSIANLNREKLPVSPLAPSAPLPKFPCTNFCSWSFNEHSRVLLAKFHVINGHVEVKEEDEIFLLRMMERTDITVISENLAYGLNSKLWNLAYIKGFVDKEFHHKIRTFEKQNSRKDSTPTCTLIEKNGFLSMQMSDFINYLEKRCSDDADRTFSFTPFMCDSPKEINVDDIGLYLIDYDLVKLLPRCYEIFKTTFKLTNLLPGGLNCMMNSVNQGGRPFMGPNLYITPPDTFTHFHQDGFGTVDSGHLCLNGYNEVVMLRRLPERHKHHALHILNGNDRRSKLVEYDALYGMPHSDGEKPPWPDQHAIDKCKEMNYYPSVFILKPGQLVHINKGRLHAFRKMGLTPLCENDCHRVLRTETIREEKLTSEVICISIAWDWMYRGVTTVGISEELESTLTCASLAVENGRQSLAIPETSTIHLVRSLIAEYKAGETLNFSDNKSMSILSTSTASDNISTTNLLKGILPSLRQLVTKHELAYDFVKKKQGGKRNESLIPNSWQNPELFSLNPYGDGDFFCKLCFRELPNMYMHCDGCERLLNKDFNICSNCFLQEQHKQFVLMHPQSKRRHSTLNHTGNMTLQRTSRCPCRNGPQCQECNYCMGCSCTCHQEFSINFRFMSIHDEKSLLCQAESIIKTIESSNVSQANQSIEVDSFVKEPDTTHKCCLAQDDGSNNHIKFDALTNAKQDINTVVECSITHNGDANNHSKFDVHANVNQFNDDPVDFSLVQDGDVDQAKKFDTQISVNERNKPPNEYSIAQRDDEKMHDESNLQSNINENSLVESIISQNGDASNHEKIDTHKNNDNEALFASNLGRYNNVSKHEKSETQTHDNDTCGPLSCEMLSHDKNENGLDNRGAAGSLVVELEYSLSKCS